MKIDIVTATEFVKSDETLCPICKSIGTMDPDSVDINGIEDTMGDDCVVILPYHCNVCGIKIDMIYKLTGYRISGTNKVVTE